MGICGSSRQPPKKLRQGLQKTKGNHKDLSMMGSLWRSAAAGGSERAATALANLAARLSAEEISIAEQRHAASGRAR